jgi:hypothetical protein
MSAQAQFQALPDRVYFSNLLFHLLRLEDGTWTLTAAPDKGWLEAGGYDLAAGTVEEANKLLASAGRPGRVLPVKPGPLPPPKVQERSY